MKAKYLIIASLILAILTIGAVSASDDVAVDDGLAASDVTEDPVEEAPVDEVMEQNEDSEPLEDISPSDFNVKIKDSIDLDDNDQNVINYTAPEGADGNIEVYVDHRAESSYVEENITPGDNYTVSLNQLDIYYDGTYHIEVTYVSDDGDSVVLKQQSLKVTKTYDKRDFDFDWNTYIDSKFDRVLEFYGYPTKGTLILSVNGNKRFNATINNPEFGTSIRLSDLNITSNGEYTVSTKFIVNSTGQEVNFGQKTIEVDVDDWNADEYVRVYGSANILDSDDEVAHIDDYSENLNGTVTVEVDGDEIWSKVFKDDEEKTELKITIGLLKLYNNITSGEHTVKVVYMKNDAEKHEVIKSVEFYGEYYDEYVRVDSSVDILSHDEDVVVIEDYEEYLNGNVSVYIDGDLKFTKNIEQKHEYGVTVDDLKLYDNIVFGTHKVKAVFMKNGMEKHEIEKSVEFYAEPVFYYSEFLSVGEKETLVINYVKNFPATATLYCAVWDGDEEEWVSNGTAAGSAKFVNGIATIPFGSLAKGDHHFILNITGYPYERNVEVDVRENTPGYSASVSASEITVGSGVVVKFNSPKSDNKVDIDVDGNDYASVMATGALSQTISGLTVGTHKIKVFFEDEDNFYSNTFYVTVKEAPAPAKKADTVKLTLKKVKVKKSAKKLVLQATLKINGKAVKGKVIKFKFNKKTYKAKTNKKGVAKVTVKKSVLKKLKVGKKVKIQATYGKTTKKLTVKVKR